MFQLTQMPIPQLFSAFPVTSVGRDYCRNCSGEIVTPPIPLPIGEKWTDENGIKFFQNAAKKARLLATLYADLTKEKKCNFLDISEDIYPSEIGGLHLDKLAHSKLAIIMGKKIIDILKD